MPMPTCEEGKAWSQSSITALLSAGFQSNVAIDMLGAAPPVLNAFVKRALECFKDGRNQNWRFGQKSVHRLVLSDAKQKESCEAKFLSSPEDNVEDCAQTESHRSSYGYLHVSIPQNSFDQKQIIFDSHLSELFSLDEAAIHEILDFPTAKFLFDAIDFVSMIVHELENLGEHETIQYLRIIPPFSEPKLVSIHTRKYFEESGKLREVKLRRYLCSPIATQS
jgi:hypothetical protein